MLQSFIAFIHNYTILGVLGGLLLARPLLRLLGNVFPSKLIDWNVIRYKGPVCIILFYSATVIECALFITLLFFAFGPFNNLQYFPNVPAFLDLSVIFAIVCGPVAFYMLTRRQFLPFREFYD